MLTKVLVRTHGPGSPDLAGSSGPGRHVTVTYVAFDAALREVATLSGWDDATVAGARKVTPATRTAGDRGRTCIAGVIRLPTARGGPAASTAVGVSRGRRPRR